MRELVDRDRIEQLLVALGRAAEAEGHLFLVGGASAVLFGFRPTTIDVDLELLPSQDSVLRAIPALKERLRVNVELASPAHFIPELPGWRERSPFVARFGKLSVFHYDLYAQALAKIERSHRQDLADVRDMLREKLIDRDELRRLFDEIVPFLYRYPAVDEASFRRSLESALSESAG
jgi:hypothetical protein